MRRRQESGKYRRGCYGMDKRGDRMKKRRDT